MEMAERLLTLGGVCTDVHTSISPVRHTQITELCSGVVPGAVRTATRDELIELGAAIAASVPIHEWDTVVAPLPRLRGLFLRWAIIMEFFELQPAAWYDQYTGLLAYTPSWRNAEFVDSRIVRVACLSRLRGRPVLRTFKYAANRDGEITLGGYFGHEQTLSLLEVPGISPPEATGARMSPDTAKTILATVLAKRGESAMCPEGFPRVPTGLDLELPECEATLRVLEGVAVATAIQHVEDVAVYETLREKQHLVSRSDQVLLPRVYTVVDLLPSAAALEAFGTGGFDTSVLPTKGRAAPARLVPYKLAQPYFENDKVVPRNRANFVVHALNMAGVKPVVIELGGRTADSILRYISGDVRAQLHAVNNKIDALLK